MTVHAHLDPSPVSESFKRSMADLSRRLGERAASQSAPDPSTSAETRRAALQAHDRARLRGLAILVGGGIAAVATGVALASLVPDEPESAPPIVTASVVPTPAASEPTVPPPPVASVAAAETTPPPPPAPEPPAPIQTAAVEPAPDPNTLRVDEVKELQVKLRSFGFNPGPVDGVAGPQTQSAATRYQQARGQPQTGTVDRQLLDQLRQNPSPPVVQQVAQRAPRPDSTRPAMQASPAPRRSSDPFEPMRRWVESLFR
jgi:putative peptidoglycan binding protein